MSSSEDPKFELRIIRVDWAEKDDVASIESAQHPISLQRAASGEFFSAEMPAYPKVDGMRHGQLAVSTGVDAVPQISTSEESIPMESVSDSATGKEWWIEKGAWKSVSASPVAPGYHDAPSCRHGGDVLLEIGNQRCQVHFTPPGFDKEEFDKLLSDFKDECWQLILSNESYTTAPAEEESAVPGQDFIEQAREVLQATKQILKNPHRELREEQSLQRTSRVRPVPRTFKELASKGWPRKVTGRSHQPDYNTPENQYVASIIERLLRAVQSLERGGEARRDRLGQQIDWMNKRVENMKKGVTQVDPTRLENFADREEERVQEWRARAESIFPFGYRRNDEVEEARVVFRVTSQPTTEYGGDLSFYADALEGSEGITTLENHLFRFKFNFTDTSFFEKGNTYEAYLYFQLHEQRDRTGRRYARWKLNRMADVDVVQSGRLRDVRHLRRKAESIRSQGEEHRKVGLQRPWERDEQKRERQSLQKRTKFYDQIRTQWSERLKALRRLQRHLSQVSRQLKERGIESSLHARYPGTMVFVQQPAYRAAHSAYQNLQDASGFRADLFDKLLTLDDLSILDLPTVYERWCLLQIVRVLEEEYGFEAVVEDVEQNKSRSSWRKDLVDTVTQTAEEAFKVNFYSSQLQRRVVLTYQAELPNGRRPDFLLEVQGKDTRREDSTTGLERWTRSSLPGNEPSAGRENRWLREKRLVLDAKFKQYRTSKNRSEEKSLGDEINWLVNAKDYAEEDEGRRNTVFVLHPSTNAVPSPGTSQEWATSSYYGGEKVFEWQDGLPDHQHGGVLVRPQRRDDIKRLLAMALTYPGEDNRGVGEETDEIKQKLFCVVCGGVNVYRLQTERANNSKGVWYRCSNEHCKHFMVLHYCGSCDHRLWKHGSYWTFHDTHPLSPYNIKCPNCGSYVPVSKDNNDEL